jgi:hypothetical protein
MYTGKLSVFKKKNNNQCHEASVGSVMTLTPRYGLRSCACVLESVVGNSRKFPILLQSYDVRWQFAGWRTRFRTEVHTEEVHVDEVHWHVDDVHVKEVLRDFVLQALPSIVRVHRLSASSEAYLETRVEVEVKKIVRAGQPQKGESSLQNYYIRSALVGVKDLIFFPGETFSNLP